MQEKLRWLSCQKYFISNGRKTSPLQHARNIFYELIKPPAKLKLSMSVNANKIVAKAC